MVKLADRFESIADPTVLETLKLTARSGIISFAGGTPSPETFPIDLLKQVLRRVKINLQYSPAEGNQSLRETVAERYSRKWGVKVSPDQVLVSAGSQQALDLIARTFLNKGDGVFVENPTYFVALYAFNAYKPKYVSRWDSAKMAYLVSNFKNPSGESIDEIGRKEIARDIKNNNRILIEDDPYGELYFRQVPPKPIYCLAPKNTVYVTSLSKIVGPAMRMGIIIADKNIINKLARVKTGMDLCTSGWLQDIANYVLSAPEFDGHLEKTRRFYARKCRIMLDALGKYMPDEVSWTTPAGGMFIWLTLPKKVDTKKLNTKALARNVAFIPGYIFDPEKSVSNKLRLSYALPGKGDIDKGIKTLADVIQSEL